MKGRGFCSRMRLLLLIHGHMRAISSHAVRIITVPHRFVLGRKSWATTGFLHVVSIRSTAIWMLLLHVRRVLLLRIVLSHYILIWWHTRMRMLLLIRHGRLLRVAWMMVLLWMHHLTIGRAIIWLVVVGIHSPSINRSGTDSQLLGGGGHGVLRDGSYWSSMLPFILLSSANGTVPGFQKVRWQHLGPS